MGITKAQRNILIGMVGVFVCCLLPLLGVLTYWLVAPRVGPGRPLVLIHQPASGQRVQMGHAVPVHSTARDDRKVARVELWADGQLLSSQNSPSPGGVSPMTLMQGWQPTSPGMHTLIVRAFNPSGGSGQASVMVEVSTEATPPLTPTLRPGETPTPTPTLPPGCQPPVGAFMAQEGDTLDSIATGLGVPAEQVRACNPDLGSGPLRSGTVVLVPVREGETVTGTPTITPTGTLTETTGLTPTATLTETATATPTPTPTAPPPGGEGVPSPDGPAPADPIPEGLPEPGGPPPISLEFEALVLEVDGVYMYVYCYGALGPSDYARIPPEPGYLAPAAGERRWDIAAYAAGAHRQTFAWPPADPLRVAARCVGITDPLHSYELGNFENTHPPAEWDGRRLVGTGTNGSRWFRVEYRINPAGATGGVIPPPTNLHRQDIGPFHLLRWDWAGDESTINGFRIYLNDSVQWAVTSPSARHTSLPAAWLTPPCGETYRFHVTAYRGPLSAGVESISSDPVVIEGLPCDNVWRITYDRIHFTSVTGDGMGWPAGPLDGTFWGNGRSIHFYSGPPGDPWWGTYVWLGTYNVLDIFFGGRCLACPTGGPPDNTLTVPLATGDALTIGAQIYDLDLPADAPDEPLCSGAILPIDFAALTDGAEGDITCDTAWAHGTVHFTLHRGTGGGGGGGGGGLGVGPALPDLTITNMWLVPPGPGGVLHLAVQNAGTVPVASWDLAVRLQRASTSEDLGTYTFSGFSLAPNAIVDLSRPEWVLGDLTDLIVTLDPLNALPEANEGNNTRAGGDYLGFALPVSPPPAHTQTFGVVYHYHSNHGPMQVRVTPLHLGAPVAGLPSVSIGPFPNGDSGMIPMAVTYTGPARAYTEQLRFEMVDGSNVAFYSYTIDHYRLIWTP